MEALIEPQAAAECSNPAVVVLGSTSPIARAVALELARAGCDIVLGARDEEENTRIACDIAVRTGVQTWTLAFDAEDFQSHPALLGRCIELAGKLDGMVAAFGYMDEQAKGQAEFAVARRTIDINYTACVSLCELFAAHFEKQPAARAPFKKPFIAVISSVAGDRGRQSNYIYGSTKSALSAYLQGLRNRLFHTGVDVCTVKPGFVDTRMTFARDLKAAAEPGAVGKSIVRAICKGRDVVYVPWPWRYIMLIIRHIPELVFKRLRM